MRLRDCRPQKQTSARRSTGNWIPDWKIEWSYNIPYQQKNNFTLYNQISISFVFRRSYLLTLYYTWAYLSWNCEVAYILVFNNLWTNWASGQKRFLKRFYFYIFLQRELLSVILITGIIWFKWSIFQKPFEQYYKSIWLMFSLACNQIWPGRHEMIRLIPLHN